MVDLVGLRGEVSVASVGEGGALVKKKVGGFEYVSLGSPTALDRLGDSKNIGSTFSESSSDSNDVALRLGEVLWGDGAR